MSGWLFTCMSICSRRATSWSSPGEEEKGEKEGVKEGYFPCPKSSLWAAVRNEDEESETLPPGTWLGGEKPTHAWVQNWMLLCWRVRALLQVVMQCAWHGNQGIGFTGNPLTKGVLSKLFHTTAFQGQQMSPLKVGDERLAQWKGCNICSITLSGLHPLHVGGLAIQVEGI